MKKQLLIAAVVASMTSVAMADISISGSGGDYTMKADVTLTGKSGDTTVTANLSLDGTPSVSVEDLYVTTSVSGVNVKMGTWRSGKSELGTASTTVTERVNVSTTFGGLSLAYEELGASNSTTIGGSLAGVKLTRALGAGATFEATYTETKASGSMGGVSVSAHASS